VKIACDRDELVAALQNVARIPARGGVVQVLAGVALEAADGRLNVSATDLELSCRAHVTCRVDEPGVVVPSARRLLEVVKRLPGRDVEIAAGPGGSNVRVVCGESEYLLRGSDPGDFSQLPAEVDGTSVEIDGAAFVATIARVVRAASTDLSRPVYTGVQMRIDDDAITLVATDGYRLASKRTTTAGGAAPVDVVVPARALAELVRLARGEEPVRVTVSRNTIEFVLPGVTLWARLLDGRPQNHAAILGGAFSHDARVPRHALLAAVDRAAVMIERNAPLELVFDRSELSLHVRTADAGEAHERVPLTAPVEPFRIGFNARYLRDGLELVEGDEVVFRMNDGIRPVVLRGASDDFSYLVAPLRIAG
jgi:DNA polymerase-3 subunit beta